MSIRRPALDVSRLPDHAFGAQSLTWWGTLGLMAIEGTAFALAMAMYFYLRLRVNEWPPNLPPPMLIWGSLAVVVIVASAVPNELARRAASREDLHAVRIWLTVTTLFEVALIGIRVLEFGVLGCRWDTNAYGSAVWLLIGLHTTHLVTDAADSVVLLVLMFTGPIQHKRFADVEENSLYWYFVVVAWLPIYAVIYWVPRIL